jgi:hypothetical protein
VRLRMIGRRARNGEIIERCLALGIHAPDQFEHSMLNTAGRAPAGLAADSAQSGRQAQARAGSMTQAMCVEPPNLKS